MQSNFSHLSEAEFTSRLSELAEFSDEEEEEDEEQKKDNSSNKLADRSKQWVEGLLIIHLLPFLYGYFSAHHLKWYLCSQKYWPFVPNTLFKTQDQNLQLTPLSESTSIPDTFRWKSPPPGPLPYLPQSVLFFLRVSVLPINHQSIKHSTSQSDSELINVQFFCHTITGTWSQSFVQLTRWRIF